MTKEEAIKELNEVKLYFDADDKIQQALTLAIQRLESNYCNNSNSSEVSDEEIENEGKRVFNDDGHTIFTHYNTVPSWINGAKWMRKLLTNK